MNEVGLNNLDLKMVQSSGESSRTSNAGTAEAGVRSPQKGSTASEQPSNASAASAAAVAREQAVAQEKRAAEQEQDSERVDQAVSRLNDYVQSVQRDLRFSVDDDSGKTVVKVMDRQTDEVIRQIPDEVAMRLAEKLQQDEPLTLFDIKV
ncbi:flagellar protein FlaG [Marinobacter xestospongiae]|uniref:Flagellar protein FlaG n=1 Tax=Marinobacter xestospongiae TaxID=994319 RepID=A0ABU3W0B2_9GAMM|nr:flagellar protein FlaG [Marinobacter xestospongiae]MCK7567946.1 flagellar protein FlaG [Marinobacter xestospongiae]MDV2079973.1 flagellar protein FlaG [Marinobacter xestospongiae]